MRLLKMDFSVFQLISQVIRPVVLLLLSGNIAVSTAEETAKLDMIGGRIENGKYRCFAEPCFSIVKNAKLTNANKTSVHFDPADWRYDVPSSAGCQITRTVVLTKTSQIEPHIKQQGVCKIVVAGKWLDAYTGKSIDSPEAVAIDHRISLIEAYRYGGAFWPNRTKVAFANDPDNLMTVSASKKDDRNGFPASRWMPDDNRYWCDYVVHRELIAQRYELIFTIEEEEFNKQIKMSHCKY